LFFSDMSNNAQRYQYLENEKVGGYITCQGRVANVMTYPTPIMID
jgi:hypothetical protein